MKKLLFAAFAAAALVVFAAPAAEATSVYYRDNDRTIGYTDLNQWGPPRRPPVVHRAPVQRLSPAKEAELDRLLQQKTMQVFGPAPTDNHSWKGVQRNFLPKPRGCTEERQRYNNGTGVRVVCN